MDYHLIGFKFLIPWCPEIFFPIAPLSIFLWMWLPMGHWTGRSVLQGALQRIFLLTCLAGVFSLMCTHIDSRFARKFLPILAFYKISNYLSARSIWMHLPCCLWPKIYPFGDWNACVNVTVEGQKEWILHLFPPSACVWVLLGFQWTQRYSS